MTLPRWPIALYLILLLLPLRFMMGPVQMTTLRLYLCLILPILLIRASKRAEVRLGLHDVALLAFPLWVGIAMAQNSPANALEQAGMTAAELSAAYLLGRCLITSAGDLRNVITFCGAALCLLVPLALFETLTGRPPLIEALQALPLLSTVGIVDIPSRLGLERVQAVFAHPIHYGLFASTLVSLSWVGLRGAASPVLRLSLSAVAAGSAFLALSSGAFLSVLIQLFLIAWATAFSATRRSWAALLALCALAYIAIDMVSNRSPVQVFFSYATFSSHNAYWRGLIFEWGMVNVWQNPIFGLGLRDWVRPHFMYSGSMDNFWLVNAVRFGLPGFTLIALAWAIGCGRVMLAPSDPNAGQLRLAWVFCMIGLTFTLATVHVWTAIYSYVFFLLGAGQCLSRTEDGLGLRSEKPNQTRDMPRYSRAPA